MISARTIAAFLVLLLSGCNNITGMKDLVFRDTGDAGAFDNSGGTDTDTDAGIDTDTDTDTLKLICGDLSQCELNNSADADDPYSCPDGEDPKRGCWRIPICDYEVMCATLEEACIVECDELDCNSLDSDPPLPGCQ